MASAEATTKVCFSRFNAGFVMAHRTATLVVFGDSLSDNGNLFDLTGFPQPPAWEGRSSNGPVYAEQLATVASYTCDSTTAPSQVRKRATYRRR